MKKHKKNNKIAKLIFFFLAVSVAGRYLWLFFCKIDRLKVDVQSITVKGNSLVSDNDIRSILKQAAGKNILKIDIKALENKMKTLPWVRSARIKRNFPNSLSVVIEEVKPAGYIIKDEKRYVVTDD